MRHIVYGWAGEYSDTRIWLVRSFSDEEAARRFADLLTEDARRLMGEGLRRDLLTDGMWLDKEGEAVTPDPPPLDPGVEVMLYGSTHYAVVAVPEGGEAPLGYEEGTLT